MSAPATPLSTTHALLGPVSPSLASLPPEVLQRVLQHLPLAALCRLAATCRALHAAAWPCVALAPDSQLARAAFRPRALRAWLRHAPRALRLRLSSPSAAAAFPPSAALALATALPRSLHALSLYGLPGHALAPLCAALARGRAPLLQHLDLGYAGLVRGEAPAVGVKGTLSAALQGCPALRSLTLDSAALGARQGGDSLRALLAACATLPQLADLQLGDNALADASTAAALDGLTSPPRLVRLELRRNALGARAVRALTCYLSAAHALEHLDLTANTALDDTAVQALLPLLVRRGGPVVAVTASETNRGAAGTISRPSVPVDSSTHVHLPPLRHLILRRCPYTDEGEL